MIHAFTRPRFTKAPTGDPAHTRPGAPLATAARRMLPLLLVLPGLAIAHGVALDPPADEDRLIRFPDTGDYLTLVVDLHTHSVFSDGHVWPRIRVGEALRDGLDALAITEHLEWQPHRVDIPHPDRNRAHAEAVAAAAGHELMIVAGTEITREQPAGHMNAVFIEDANVMLKVAPEAETDDAEDYYIAANRWPPERAVQAANDQGAFVFWNHAWWQSPDNPAAPTVMTDFHRGLIESGQLHGIEIANGIAYAEDAFQLALDHGLTPLGVSDVHELIDWDYRPAAGGHRPVTLVLAAERSQAALREALFAGRTVVWFEETLIGREPHLVSLLRAALDVDEVNYNALHNLVYVTVSNASDAPIRLRNRGGYSMPGQTGDVEVPPHGTAQFALRSDAVPGEVELDFEVLNALIAPKVHPRLTHKLRIEAAGGVDQVDLAR
ncbi:MAG: Sb-PDE family phosphodiesterase [Gammaproteobacteria bacterium]|nr:Sb-PDE family phosphodiesterase [Gammaproteobacteria bacterium]